MPSRIREHLRSNVVAYLALFVALGGTGAYAANELKGGVKKNSIKSKQIKDGQVKGADLADGAVTSAKVADNSLTGTDVLAGSIGKADLAAGAQPVAFSVPADSDSGTGNQPGSSYSRFDVGVVCFSLKNAPTAGTASIDNDVSAYPVAYVDINPETDTCPDPAFNDAAVVTYADDVVGGDSYSDQPFYVIFY